MTKPTVPVVSILITCLISPASGSVSFANNPGPATVIFVSSLVVAVSFAATGAWFKSMLTVNVADLTLPS